jgi:hypothetical protein
MPLKLGGQPVCDDCFERSSVGSDGMDTELDLGLPAHSDETKPFDLEALK